MLSSHALGILTVIVVALSGIIAVIKAIISGQGEDE